MRVIFLMKLFVTNLFLILWLPLFVFSQESSQGITGEVRYHQMPGSDSILGRTVIVWLPSGYADSSKRTYPVLYMQDGQNLVDPKTSSFGYDWHFDEVADSLIRAGLIEPFILVGIYNSPQRTAEYMTSLVPYYTSWMTGLLKSFIDSVYHTSSGRESTFTGGSSAGGAIAFELLWEHNDVFSKAMCMSPAFIDYPNQGLVNLAHRVKADTNEKRFMMAYFDMGGHGVDSLLKPGLDLMVLNLEESGYHQQTDFFVVFDPLATHSERDWHARLPEALILLFGKR